MLKIHILGANGYIGSFLTYFLENKGFQVEKAEYRLPYVKEKSIDADIVIYLSFLGGGTEHKPRKGNDNPEQMYKVNVEGMSSLLNGIKNKNTKIIYLSSTAVYGKFTDIPIVDENSELKATSMYGIHKIEAEKILMKSQFEWIILRPCGIFGPSLNNNFGNSFLNTVLTNAISNKEIIIINKDQKIDTLYNLDLIHLLFRICDGEWYSKEIFNIGGEIVSIKKMLFILTEKLFYQGFKCSVKTVESNIKPAILTDSGKLKNTFKGWKNTPLEKSFQLYVSAFLDYANNRN